MIDRRTPLSFLVRLIHQQFHRSRCGHGKEIKKESSKIFSSKPHKLNNSEIEIDEENRKEIPKLSRNRFKFKLKKAFQEDQISMNHRIL